MSLAQGLRVLSSSPTLRQFSILFSTCLPPAPPVHPAVIGYLAFSGLQIQGLFSWNSNGLDGTSGAYITCCEDRPVLLREFLARPQDICLHDSQCLLSAQASWLYQVRITASGCKKISILHFCMCVYTHVSNIQWNMPESSVRSYAPYSESSLKRLCFICVCTLIFPQILGIWCDIHQQQLTVHFLCISMQWHHRELVNMAS